MVVRTDVLVWPDGNGRLHRHSARRIHLRVEEGSVAMGLTSRPDPNFTELSGDEPWITTKLDAFVNWGRKNSLWPMPFGTACCAIEFMAAAASKYDIARFGMERQAFSPRPAGPLVRRGRAAGTR